MKRLFTLFIGTAMLMISADVMAGPGDTLGVTADTEPRFAPNNISYTLKYKPPTSVVDSGFVYGTLFAGTYNFIANAQAYSNYDTVEVTQILAFISHKAKGPNNTPNTKITYRLHKYSPTGASDGATTTPVPGPAEASLALKEQLFEEVDTSRSGGLHYNVITLDNPVKYSNENIVISVDFQNVKAAGDTIALLCDQPGSGLGLNYTWHQILYSGIKLWFRSTAFFPGQLDNNVALFPVLAEDDDVSIEKTPFFQGMKAVVMPNPAIESATLRYEVQYSGAYQLEVISANGQIVSTQDLGYKSVGSHQNELNVSDLASGTYLYSLSNKDAGIRYTKSFVVSK